MVALCSAAALQGLMWRTGPRASAIRGWAMGALVIQSAVGMFMLTATNGASAIHIALALAGLAAVLGVRLALPDATPRVVGSAFLVALATSLTAFITGVTAA